MFQRFNRSEGGAVAILFALSLIPMIAFAGLAIDYSRASALRTEIQNASDTAALQVVLAAYENRTVDAETAFANAFKAGITYANLDLTGNWTVPGKIYRLEAAVSSPTTLLSLIGSSLDIRTVTMAELLSGVKIAPVAAMMAPEAADYNELRLYCFQPPKNGRPGKRLGPINVNTGVRAEPILIANNKFEDSNKGLLVSAEQMKDYECGRGEAVSYHMHNIRDARTDRNPYNRPKSSKYDYYTDTVVENGKVTFNTNPSNIIETVYCAGKSQCKPKSQGGIIPEGKYRKPQVHTSVCTDGYLYMGWEDRPTGDADYDDIRIVMECQDLSNNNGMRARLIR